MTPKLRSVEYVEVRKADRKRKCIAGRRASRCKERRKEGACVGNLTTEAV